MQSDPSGRVDVVAAVRAAAAQREPHRRSSWRLITAVLVVAAVAVGCVVVWASQTTRARGVLALPTRSVQPASSTTPVSPPAAAAAPTESWTEVIAALDDARAAALSRNDLELLTAVDEPGAAIFRADLALMRSLQQRGLRADGFVLDVQGVEIVTAASDRVVLRVVDSRPAYTWRNLSGAVVGQVAARPRAAWSVTLVRGGVLGWRVAKVDVASSAARPRASPRSSGR